MNRRAIKTIVGSPDTGERFAYDGQQLAAVSDLAGVVLTRTTVSHQIDKPQFVNVSSAGATAGYGSAGTYHLLIDHLGTVGNIAEPFPFRASGETFLDGHHSEELKLIALLCCLRA